MDQKLLTILVLLFLSVVSITAQDKVRFYNENFEKVLDIAKLEGKSVFVDTWASWCIPCKKQEKVFQNPEVIKYLNENFISLRVDMGKSKLTNKVSKLGKKLNLEFEVVFLPTLLVLNENGKLKVKTDNFLNSAELLSFLRYSKNREAKVFKSGLNNIPFSTSGSDEVYVAPIIKTKSIRKDSIIKTDIIGNETTKDSIIKERYLFVEGDQEFVHLAAYYYNQTDIELQNMDNEYKISFKKYLNTQQDWSSKKNMKFIYNYVNSTQSEAFEYIIENRHDFEDLVGVERYLRSIQVLIYNRLYHGYPRADLEDAKRLYGYLYTEVEADKYAYQFYLQQLLVDKDFVEFIRFAKDAIVSHQDIGLMLSLANVYILEVDKPKEGLKVLKIIKESEVVDHQVYLAEANALLQLRRHKKALKALTKAKELSGVNNVSFPEWEFMMHRINKAYD